MCVIKSLQQQVDEQPSAVAGTRVQEKGRRAALCRGWQTPAAADRQAAEHLNEWETLKQQAEEKSTSQGLVDPCRSKGKSKALQRCWHTSEAACGVEKQSSVENQTALQGMAHTCSGMWSSTASWRGQTPAASHELLDHCSSRRSSRWISKELRSG